MSVLSLARCLERRCPPEQVINHRLRLRLKLSESFVHVTALEMRPKSRYGNMEGGANRGHLNLNCGLPELLDATRPSRFRSSRRQQPCGSIPDKPNRSNF